jgi:small subunit ribosomal protein S11
MAKAPIKKVLRKKKKIAKHVPQAHVYIQATYNNTIVTLADLNGNVLAWSSAGLCGFRGPKKSTPYAAGVIVKDAITKAKDFNITDVHAFVKGVGTGREAAVRALNANGLNVLSIRDLTPIPHNGPRAPRVRRV